MGKDLKINKKVIFGLNSVWRIQKSLTPQKASKTMVIKINKDITAEKFQDLKSACIQKSQKSAIENWY